MIFAWGYKYVTRNWIMKNIEALGALFTYYCSCLLMCGGNVRCFQVHFWGTCSKFSICQVNMRSSVHWRHMYMLGKTVLSPVLLYYYFLNFWVYVCCKPSEQTCKVSCTADDALGFCIMSWCFVHCSFVLTINPFSVIMPRFNFWWLLNDGISDRRKYAEPKLRD